MGPLSAIAYFSWRVGYSIASAWVGSFVVFTGRGMVWQMKHESSWDVVVRNVSGWDVLVVEVCSLASYVPNLFAFAGVVGSTRARRPCGRQHG